MKFKNCTQSFQSSLLTYVRVMYFLYGEIKTTSGSFSLSIEVTEIYATLYKKNTLFKNNCDKNEHGDFSTRSSN